MDITLKHIAKTPDKLGGTPAFAGTRISLYLLVEYLRDGCNVQDFVDQYDIDPPTFDGFLKEPGLFVADASDRPDSDAWSMSACKVGLITTL